MLKSYSKTLNFTKTGDLGDLVKYIDNLSNKMKCFSVVIFHLSGVVIVVFEQQLKNTKFQLNLQHICDKLILVYRRRGDKQRGFCPTFPIEI